jgi:hypothetical protein
MHLLAVIIVGSDALRAEAKICAASGGVVDFRSALN